VRAALEHRTRSRTVSILGALGLMAGMLAITTPSSVAATCLAKDGAVSNSNLQTVIDGASTGDTIVITGTCVGNFSIPGAGSATKLTLKAQTTATLDGNDSGPVVTVIGASEIVSIKDLSITNGHTIFGGGAGGIDNEGTVNLSGKTMLTGNFGGISNVGVLNLSGHAKLIGGGGIYNDGSVSLSGHAVVQGNLNEFGGGIYNDYDGTVYMSGNAELIGNSVSDDGGGIYNNGTVYLMDNALLRGNSAHRGGGIFNYLSGTVYMSGNALVTRNRARPCCGGGIYNQGGTLVGAVAGVNVKNNKGYDIYP
jgi:hypothetical protein